MRIGGYEVAFERGEDGDWWAHFPDGPCVISVADTREEVIREQEKGLEFLLEFEAEEREKEAAKARLAAP